MKLPNQSAGLERGSFMSHCDSSSATVYAQQVRFPTFGFSAELPSRIPARPADAGDLFLALIGGYPCGTCPDGRTMICFNGQGYC